MATDGSVFIAEEDNDDDEKTEPVLASPPRKKTKVEMKAEKKKAKPQVRAAVKAAQVAELEKGRSKAQGRKNAPAMTVDDGDEVLDLDPTPVKAKRTAGPAAELDDHDDQWATPTRGGNNGPNVDANPRRHRDEGKGQGESKGKRKLEDNEANMLKPRNSSDQKGSDVNRVPPKSKK